MHNQCCITTPLWKRRRYVFVQCIANTLNKDLDNNILTCFITGLMTISPSETASACSGDQLNLTCTVTGSFLQWSFSLIPEGETTARGYIFTVTSLNPTNQAQQLRVNSSIFTFLRSSAANSVPLISRLIINAASHNLNQTVVTCSDVEATESVSTTINIINESQDLINGEVMQLGCYIIH